MPHLEKQPPSQDEWDTFRAGHAWSEYCTAQGLDRFNVSVRMVIRQAFEAGFKAAS